MTRRLLGLLFAAVSFGTSGPASAQPLPVAGFEAYCSEQDRQISCRAPLDRFGCDVFVRPPASFQDLEPSRPLLVCGRESAVTDAAPNAVLTVEGIGWMAGRRISTSYIMEDAEGFHLLDSVTAFRQAFVPVMSAGEAAAFVVALGLGEVLADTSRLKNLPGHTYYLAPEEIGPSTAVALGDGFEVTVYSSSDPCAMEMARRQIKISPAGDATTLNSTSVWRREHPCIY